MPNKAPARASQAGSRRLSTRSSIMGGPEMPRMFRTRRQSIHESGSGTKAGVLSKQIKRQFYGLEDAETEIKEFWNNHSGGLISFTTVLLYYVIGLIYYQAQEGWDTITTLYFQTVTLTTVGYGDYAPTTTHARVFTIFYIFAGIIIEARIISSFGQSILDYAEKQAKQHSKENIAMSHHSTSFYLKKMMGPLMAIWIVLFLGALFYHKNEGWDFSTALYFAVVTTTTVGYGDTGLTKESSRLFAIFYILSSCVIVALSLGNLATITLEMKNDKKRTELHSRKLDFNFIRELDTGDNGIDKLSFLVSMLVQLELVDKDRDVKPWLEKFDQLDKSKKGVIDFDEAIADLEAEEQARIAEFNKHLHEVQDADNVLGAFMHRWEGGGVAPQPAPQVAMDEERGIEMGTVSEEYEMNNPMRAPL